MRRRTPKEGKAEECWVREGGRGKEGERKKKKKKKRCGWMDAKEGP